MVRWTPCRAALVAAILLAAGLRTAGAQPTLNRLLSSVAVTPSGTCATIDIAFNRPVTFTNRFPAGTGAEILIGIAPLGTTQTPQPDLPPLEAASVAAANSAGLRSVVYDAGKTANALMLTFESPVQFAVSRDSNASHIVIATAPPGGLGNCKGDAPAPGGSAAAGGDIGQGGDAGQGGNALAEGKKSLAAGDFTRAIALFTKASTSGSAASRIEAQEMLGLAHERAGQLAHAKAVYAAYLKANAGGAGAARVRERLAGVEAAIESDAEAAFEARRKSQLAAQGDKDVTQLRSPPATTAGGKGDLSGAAAGDEGWQWQTSGSLGQSYYRGDGYTGSNLLRGTFGTHELSQSDLVTSGDVRLRGSDGNSTIEARVSAYDSTAIGASGDNKDTVSAAYVDMRNKASGLSARLGRQTRTGGGVFGRFDGGLLGYQVNDSVLLQAVAGSPVYYSDDQPFADGRYFYGASIDLTSPSKTWAGTLYAIEQDVKSAVDRRAIGGELRYTGSALIAYGGLDYDVFYSEINNAYVSGSWNASDRLSVYGDVDYRRVPFLLTSNALTGQSTDSLAKLIDLFGTNDTEALAVDRTATATTATLGLSYDLSEAWQVTLEGTVANYSGTPASGGVDKIPDPGIEYYASAQLSGSGILAEDDYVGLGLYFTESGSYRSYVADLTARYPLNDRLRIGPRLRLAYRDGVDNDVEQLLVMPSLALKYRVSDHWSFETEAAVLWEDDRTASGHEQNTDLRLSIGYRYEF